MCVCVCGGVGWVGRVCAGVLEGVYGYDIWLGLGRVDQKGVSGSEGEEEGK